MKGGGPVIPTFGGGSAHSLSCVKNNGLFCWSWFSSNWSSTLWPALRQHVVLVVIAVAIGFAISMALALLSHRYRPADQPVPFPVVAGLRPIACGVRGTANHLPPCISGVPRQGNRVWPKTATLRLSARGSMSIVLRVTFG